MTFSFVVVSNQAQVKLPTGAKEPVAVRGEDIEIRVIHVPSKETMLDHERVNLASEIVVNLNKLCRQKKAGFMDLEIVGPSGACPLCELSCVCLGPSCHGKKGELF